MKKSELINLSIGQIGLVLAYNLLTMNMHDYFENTAFGGSALSWLFYVQYVLQDWIYGTNFSLLSETLEPNRVFFLLLLVWRW